MYHHRISRQLRLGPSLRGRFLSSHQILPIQTEQSPPILSAPKAPISVQDPSTEAAGAEHKVEKKDKESSEQPIAKVKEERLKKRASPKDEGSSKGEFGYRYKGEYNYIRQY